MHSILPFLLAMVAAVVLLGMLANKLRIAYPILLVVAGLLTSLLGFRAGAQALTHRCAFGYCIYVNRALLPLLDCRAVA